MTRISIFLIIILLGCESVEKKEDDDRLAIQKVTDGLGKVSAKVRKIDSTASRISEGIHELADQLERYRQDTLTVADSIE